MASVMTLDGPRGLAGNPVGDWILGRGLVLGGIVIPLAASLAVGAVGSSAVIWVVNRAKKSAGRPALSGPSSTSRKRRRRRRR